MPDGHISAAAPARRDMSPAGRIRALADVSPRLEVAQFRFIGLDEIRKSYGARWPDKQKRVQQIAREFIARRLKRADVVVGGADGFLVVFADPDSDEARVAVASISEALNTFFLGDEFDGLDGERGPSINCAARIDFMDAGALVSLADSIPASRSPGAAAPSPPTRVRFLYQPVWAAAHQAITSYFVTPTDGRGGRIPGYHFDPLPDGPTPFLALDEIQLRVSEAGLQQLFGGGGRALVGVTIHVTSLRCHADRTRLLGVLGRFDDRLRRYRVLRLAGVEPGFPRMYLEETLRLIRPLCPNITVGLQWNDPDIASILALKPMSIGFPLHHDARGLLEPGEEVHARIRTAAASAKRAGVQVFANGDFSFATARRFAADGVGLLSSPMIWPRMAQPASMTAWPTARLLPEA